MASLRQRSLDGLLTKQRSWFKKLKGNSECRGGPSWHTAVVCDNIAYGIAARALNEAAVFPIPEDSAKVTMTFRQLSKLHYDIGHAIKATPPQVAGDCNRWFNQSSLWDSLQKHSKWKKWMHISELKQWGILCASNRIKFGRPLSDCTTVGWIALGSLKKLVSYKGQWGMGSVS